MMQHNENQVRESAEQSGFRIWVVVVSVAVLGMVVGGCAWSAVETSFNAALQQELLRMAERDQAVRRGFSSNMQPEEIAAIGRVDAEHTTRLKTIIARHGWPGKSLVGEDGAHAAWLLVQHGDMDLMLQSLPLMESAVKAGEASGKDYAYLVDRVRMRQGQKQIYGTQFSLVDGEFVLYPVENESALDSRRRAIGLPSLADYEKKLREIYR